MGCGLSGRLQPAPSFLRFLHLHGFTLDADGRAVPLVVGPDPFAVALMPMALPTIPDGPSAKSLRRRAKLAARAINPDKQTE